MLMPCKNALPWLPIAVRDCLKQTGVRTEVIVVNDSSIDGSAEWLQSLADKMGDRGSAEVVKVPQSERKRVKIGTEGATDSNPAFVMPMRVTTDAAMSKAGVADGSANEAVEAHHAFIAASNVSKR